MEYTDLPEMPVYGFAPDLGGLLNLVITFVLPLIAALLMKRTWSTGAKGTILLAVSAIKSIIVAWLAAVNTAADFEWIPILYTTVVTFVIAVAVHFGFWKGTSVQQSAINSGV